MLDEQLQKLMDDLSLEKQKLKETTEEFEAQMKSQCNSVCIYCIIIFYLAENIDQLNEKLSMEEKKCKAKTEELELKTKAYSK